ncbi:MAG: CoA transferase [Alphaproteobacteria bacterium]
MEAPVPALETMRVLEFTQWEAGPSCAMMLAWLGADVVKVEPPGGEIARKMLGVGPGDSQYFLNYNANKRGLALDLKNPKGKELLLKMLPNFDVFIENQGPGTVERLGLGPEVLCKLHPKLIYARIKGFGLDGPYSDYKSFDPLAMAAAGIFSMTGTPDGPPLPTGGTFADTGTGITTALAITAAYVQQLRTGKGQVIEMSMHEVMTMFIRTLTAMSWGPGQPPVGRRSHESMPPSGIYRCKGGGPNDYVIMVVILPNMWRALCETIGQPELTDDPRFAQPASRVKNWEELKAIITAWTGERNKHEVMRLMGAAGVPCSATMDTAEVFSDPHLIARDFFKKVQHPEKGEILMMRSPIRMSDSDVPIVAAPLAGQHSRDVLRAELGLSNEQLDTLCNEGVIQQK